MRSLIIAFILSGCAYLQPAPPPEPRPVEGDLMEIMHEIHEVVLQECRL